MSRYRSNELPDGCMIALALALVAIIIFGIGYAFAAPMHRETVTCTVDSKDRTTNQDGKSKSRVYTRDCGVFSVDDQWLAGQIRSADTYALVQPGHRYQFETTGWRIPIVSLFPNIVEAQEVQS